MKKFLSVLIFCMLLTVSCSSPENAESEAVKTTDVTTAEETTEPEEIETEPEEPETEPAEIRIGTWEADECYYMFEEGGSAVWIAKPTYIGLKFTYEEEGGSAVFHWDAEDEAVSIDFISEDNIIMYRNGKEENLSYIGTEPIEYYDVYVPADSCHEEEPSPYVFTGFKSGLWDSDGIYQYIFHDNFSGRMVERGYENGSAFGYEIISDTEVVFTMGAAGNDDTVEIEIIDENNIILHKSYGDERITYIGEAE